MGGESAGLTIEELAQRAGVSVRTVRYYISQGLLPGPGARGKWATYSDEHLARLHLIRRLAEQRVPLAEQRERLAQLSDTDVRALLRAEERRFAALERAQEAPAPRAYVTELLNRARAARWPAEASVPGHAPRPSPTRADAQRWLRWTLAPGVELHASAESAKTSARLIERLLEVAGEESGRVGWTGAAFWRGAPPDDE